MRRMAIVLCIWSAVWASGSVGWTDDLASQIVRTSGASGGVCAIVGARDAQLARAIAAQGNFVVHCLCADWQTCDRLRQQIRAAGVSGRVSADVLAGNRLPYVDNLVNIIVVEADQVPKEEITRVLCPGGVSIDPRDPSPAVRKPWPSDIDEWTHYQHGPDGNPVAEDRVVGPPAHYQWLEGPMWARCHETDSSISTLVTAQGRLFAIVDEAPVSLVGQHALPDKWSLVARDAFNGVLLWKVPIRRWGWREWKDTWFNSRPGDIPLNIQKRLVAVGDKVYITLGYQAPVSELDARTGEILKTYAGTERTNEILLHEGTLFLSVLTDAGARVMAVEAASGKQLWTSSQSYQGTTTDYIKWVITPVSRTIPKLDPALNIATDGRVVTLIDGPQVACLDARSGAERWRVEPPPAEQDRTAGNMQTKNELWVGAMIVRAGVVLQASPSQLAAFSTDTGKLLWHQPKKYLGHLWYEWKEVFVIGDLVWTWSADLESATFNSGPKGRQVVSYPKAVNGYDLQTGVLKKEIPTGPIFRAHHHHRCYRDRATVRYILASRRGTEFVDMEDGPHSVHNWVRGTCHVGMMPANGLQYVPAHPCACYIDEKLNGFFALAAQRVKELSVADDPAARLQKGPVYGFNSNPQSPILNPSASDWPAFRGGAARTGSVNTQVPDDAQPLWRVKLGSAICPPIAVDDRVFTALVDEHDVVCLDAHDGRKLWQFASGGRIDSPPTWHNGTLLFGSADGWVYCLRAADGRLAWRFRAAPHDRRMGAFGQLESIHPVHGSVLVQDGKAYFAAGRSSELDGGILLYALDAATGQVLHQTCLQGPDYTLNGQGKLAMQPPPAQGRAEFDENHQLPMGSLSDVMMSDGSRIYMRSSVFDAELKPQRGKPEQLPRSGYLDDTYFKRTPWTFGDGQNYGRLLVHDSQSIYFVRMFDSLKGLDPMVFFTPGAKGYLLFAKNLGGKRDAWSTRVPVRIRAMVCADHRLIVAGPPDSINPRDPLGAFEGRQGGLMYLVDSDTGQKVADLTLPSPPVFNGFAAARDRLYLADEDGSLTCFGSQ